MPLALLRIKAKRTCSGLVTEAEEVVVLAAEGPEDFLEAAAGVMVDGVMRWIAESTRERVSTPRESRNG